MPRRSGGNSGSSGEPAPRGAPTIVFRTSLHNTVADVMRARPGWRQTDSDTDWDINWADVGWVRDFFDHIHMDDSQRINHFRNHYELTRKDLLIKNLKRMRKHLQRTDSHSEAAKYSFWAPTYVLPAEYGLFLEEFKRTPGQTWIMKPIGRAQGRGIFLFNKLHQISEWKKDHRWKQDGPQAETYIVQRYLDRPYCIGGKKFDLRIYALVTSFSPLVVWLYRTGFARFSNRRYTNERSNMDNLYMHLTNVAIQKTAEDYDRGVGCKWDIRSVKMHMASKHGMRAVDECFYEIQCIITRSLLAVQKVIIQDRQSFELYGYDVLIDQDLKPWLIEVNASPSLTADTAADYELKRALIEDTLTVVDVEGRLSGNEENIGGFDLVWHNGPMRPPPTCSTYLGCHNDRVRNLKRIGRPGNAAAGAAAAPDSPAAGAR